MKKSNAVRKINIFICFICFFTMVFNMGAASSTGTEPEQTETAETGVWVLTGQPVLGAVITIGDDNYKDTALSISGTSASYYDKEIIGTVDGQDDFIISDAKFTFTGAPQRIKPEEIIPITIQGTYTGTSFEAEYYGVASGEAFLQLAAYGLEDDASVGSYLDILGDNNGMYLSDPGSEKVVLNMEGPYGGEGYYNKFILEYRIGGGAKGQVLTYTYEYKSDVSRRIRLLGEAVSIYQQPMPYMNIFVTPFIDDKGTVTVLEPVIIQTDVAGGFEYTGEFAPDAKGILSLKLDFLFECGIKVNITDTYASNVFEMKSLPDNNGSSVSASTTISAVIDDYKNEKDILLIRHVDFGFPSLKTPALSFGNDGKPDLFETNTANVKDLSTFSFLYCQVFNGLYTGVKTFDEKKALIDNANNLIIEMNGPDADWSYFDSNAATPTIRLCVKYTGRSDSARYTILHEFGHYFDWITNNKVFHNLPTDATKTNENHGGYFNDVTSDSVLEGFASWFACVTQKYGYYSEKNPEVMGLFGSIAVPSLPWVQNGIREEFSVSRAFWSAGEILTPVALWKNSLSKPSVDLNAVYKLFISDAEALKDGSDEKIKGIKDAFYANGLFKLPAGNGQYDNDEPFTDAGSKNGIWDAGETFIDIPNPLPAVDYGNMIFGVSADSSRTRYSTFLLPNSSIKLTGSVPEYVKVKIVPDNGTAYSYIDRVSTDGTAYIGIPEYAADGTVQVSVPGGGEIYSANIADLKTRITATRGKNDLLDETDVLRSDLPADPSAVRPTGGDPEASGYYVVDESRKKNPDSVNLVDTPFYALSDSDLRSYTAGNTTASAAGKNNYILIAAVMLTSVLAAVIFIIILRNKNKRPVYRAAAPQPNTAPQPYKTPPPPSPYAKQPQQVLGKQSFCKNCGAKIEPGIKFCEKCGNKIEWR